MKLIGRVILLGIFSAGAGYLAWRYVPRGGSGSGTGVIPPRGGKEMDVMLSVGVPHYMQGDDRWGDDKIGGSGESIRSVGCTLCSVAMGLEAMGHRWDPRMLNAALLEEGGYTDQGWLIWSAVGKVTGGAVEVVVESEPRFAVLDRCLERGWHALVKFYLPGRIPHWVLLVGKKGNEYLIKDPAYSKGDLVTLSSRARGIYSIRYLRPAASNGE